MVGGCIRAISYNVREWAMNGCCHAHQPAAANAPAVANATAMRRAAPA